MQPKNIDRMKEAKKMVKTREHSSTEKIAVDVNTLMDMLCVGRNTAYKIGEDSGAAMNIGRRKLYNVRKIKEYIDRCAEA